MITDDVRQFFRNKINVKKYPWKCQLFLPRSYIVQRKQFQICILIHQLQKFCEILKGTKSWTSECTTFSRVQSSNLLNLVSVFWRSKRYLFTPSPLSLSYIDRLWKWYRSCYFAILYFIKIRYPHTVYTCT